MQVFGSTKKLISEKYALAIGNDLARDWSTLVRSWDKDFLC